MSEYDIEGAEDLGALLPDGPDPDGQVHVHEWIEHKDGLLSGEPAFYVVCRTCGTTSGRYTPRMPDSFLAGRADD